MADPYLYPGTSLLINKFGIKDKDTLAVVEGRFFVLRSLEPLPAGQWDYDHLKAIHRHFFSDVYDWAGQERTVDLAKDDSYFARVPFIASTLPQRFHQLKEERFLQDLSLSTFCERLSYYFNEMNAVHPFREGNGRTQRAFCSQLAEQAGYYVDWKLLSTRKEDYLHANVEGFLRADYQPLTTLLMHITTPVNALCQLALFDVTINESSLLQLKDYVDKQVHLTQLVQEKHRHLLIDKSLAQALSQQTIILSKEMDALAHQLFSHADIASLLKQPHILPVSTRGGFSNIRERWQKNEMIDKDILAVLQHARNRHHQREQASRQEQGKSRKK